MNKDLISVVIPVYNGEKYLRESIQSVLEQSFLHFEIIVVDDGSTDLTEDIANEHGSNIRYHYQENQGTGAAINRGFKEAKGDFLSVIGADDLWLKDKLSLQMQAFNQDASLDMVFGMLQHFHSPDLDEVTKRKIYCPPDPIPGYSSGTMLIKRASFKQVGQYNTKWDMFEFVDWHARAKEEELKEHMLPQVVYSRRLHKTNKTLLHRDRYSDFAKILKASLDRRKKKGNLSTSQDED